MRIAIAGSGPAGLFAAVAAKREGHETTIIDRDTDYHPERIFALQYLHDPCDLPPHALSKLELSWFITGLDTKLVAAVGEERAAKYQYNSKLGRPLSEENSTRFAFTPMRTVWSLKGAYEYMWRAFEKRLQRLTLTWDNIVIDLAKDYDVVISTVPLDKILPNWEWPTMGLWITQGVTPESAHLSDGQCILNVGIEEGWTRATELDGGKATEWAKCTGPIGVAYQPLRKIIPPPRLPTLPDNVYLAGRWGSWDAGVLTHHAYYRVKNILESRA